MLFDTTYLAIDLDVIDENFAMPHARPEAGAVRPCMALTILDRPIDMRGQSIQVLLALSATDSTKLIPFILFHGASPFRLNALTAWLRSPAIKKTRSSPSSSKLKHNSR